MQEPPPAGSSAGADGACTTGDAVAFVVGGVATVGGASSAWTFSPFDDFDVTTTATHVTKRNEMPKRTSNTTPQPASGLLCGSAMTVCARQLGHIALTARPRGCQTWPQVVQRFFAILRWTHGLMPRAILPGEYAGKIQSSGPFLGAVRLTGTMNRISRTLQTMRIGALLLCGALVACGGAIEEQPGDDAAPADAGPDVAPKYSICGAGRTLCRVGRGPGSGLDCVVGDKCPTE